jgi:hypothetical protein
MDEEKKEIEHEWDEGLDDLDDLDEPKTEDDADGDYDDELEGGELDNVDVDDKEDW